MAENVDVNARWTMPRTGMVKINVHGSFFVNALPNGNVTGIGVVIRNSKGKILRLLCGSLGIRNPRINEYNAMLEGCKRAYAEKREHFVLESDHLDSFWEWRNSTIEGAHPEHANIVQQLNQRSVDRNFHMEPFGRVFELWSLDMGLGPVDPQFIAIHEEELNPEIVNNEDQEVPAVEDGEPANGDEEEVEVIEILD
ncbi:hypothetical protein ACET3Z_000827 [Daucus carota]